MKEFSADEGHTNSQRKLTYAEVLTIGDDNDLFPPAIKVLENVNSQANSDRSPSKTPSDGFVVWNENGKILSNFSYPELSKM